MRVLELENITKYDFMANSLRFVAFGDLEEAVISAYKHLNEDAYIDETRLDILLFIAKIYSKMGEVDASLNILFRALRLRVQEGRVYSLISYNFYRVGDTEYGNLYNLMTENWNERNGNILDVEDEYRHDLVMPTNKDNNIIVDEARERAWSLAFNKQFNEARCEAMKMTSDIDKLELLTALDIIEDRESERSKSLIAEMLDAGIDEKILMRQIRVLEASGKYEKIVRLLETAIKEKACTSRLAYIYAVALQNTHRTKLALRILRRLELAYSNVYPYITTTIFVIEKTPDIVIPIYREIDGYSDIKLMRDSEILRRIECEDSHDRTFFNMVRDMYEDGNITEEIVRVNSYLVRYQFGRTLLADLLLDSEVRTAKMRMYIARSLMDYDDRILLVYEKMINECVIDSRDKINRSEELDMVAFKLVAGID